jgi:small subunit ribosomal protein S20
VANHSQAKKRNRQSVKRMARNRHFRSAVRTLIKKVRTAVGAGEKEQAQQALRLAVKQLDRSVTKGVLKRETASRTISRLTIAVNRLG